MDVTQSWSFVGYMDCQCFDFFLQVKHVTRVFTCLCYLIFLRCCEKWRFINDAIVTKERESRYFLSWDAGCCVGCQVSTEGHVDPSSQEAGLTQPQNYKIRRVCQQKYRIFITNLIHDKQLAHYILLIIRKENNNTLGHQSITNARTCRRNNPMILDFFSYFSLIVFIGCQQVYKCIFLGGDLVLLIWREITFIVMLNSIHINPRFA